MFKEIGWNTRNDIKAIPSFMSGPIVGGIWNAMTAHLHGFVCKSTYKFVCKSTYKFVCKGTYSQDNPNNWAIIPAKRWRPRWGESANALSCILTRLKIPPMWPAHANLDKSNPEENGTFQTNIQQYCWKIPYLDWLMIITIHPVSKTNENDFFLSLIFGMNCN